MMKTKSISFLLMAVLMGGISLCIVSCSDDDDDNNEMTVEQREQQAEQQASTFWSVVGQLVSTTDYTADYQDKTFEPTIGVPSESNANVRIVATSDLASAAERFAALIGKEGDFDLNTADYEWKDENVGTLTYHQTQDNTSLATVDVSIRQLPHLQQIVYCTPEQVGTNASFSGNAYYRFGDVVKIKNEDNNWEYWICVRPAFGPEGKTTSHWVTLSPLPEKNLCRINKNDREYAVPTGIGTNTEHMQNLAEMLYAMCYPTEWETNVLNTPAPGLFSKGLRMFHDFSHSKKDEVYHNTGFWIRVYDAWNSLKLFHTIFGFNADDEHFRTIFEPDGGLHLLYKGYSWWSKTSNNLTLYEYTYSIGTSDTELNMHKATKRSVEGNMANNHFNLASEYTTFAPYVLNEQLFGNKQPRYVIRHATGQELVQAGAKWDYKQPISGATPVYVYNQFFYQDNNNKFCDLTTQNTDIIGNPNTDEGQDYHTYEKNSFYQLGDVLVDSDGAKWICTLPSGGLVKTPFSYFISFDRVSVGESDGKPKNFINEISVFRTLIPLFSQLTNYVGRPNEYGLIGKFLSTARNSLKVDLTQYVVGRDAKVFVEGKTEKVTKECFFLVLACQDKNSEAKLMRVILNKIADNTSNNQWRYELFTKYEGTDVPIRHSDVADQAMVDKYARDRWTEFPLAGTDELSYRTTADSRAKNLISYLWWENGFATDALSMWNDRVLVIRADKVYDRGINHHANIFENTKNPISKHIYGDVRNNFKPGETGSWVFDLTMPNLFTINGEPYEVPNYVFD